jgi:hypothetical protein
MALSGISGAVVRSTPGKGKTEMKKRVVVLSVLLFLPFCSFSQGLGSIVGRVTDPSGAAVTNAKVTAVQASTGFSRTAGTDTEGLYVIPSLQPSTYNLMVEAEGFSTVKQSNIALLADQTLTVNVSLKLGMNTEVVTVTGNALQVDTATSTLKQVIEQERLTELPLDGRNAAQLTLLVPGAINSPNGGADQGSTKTYPGAVTYSANGSRQNQISYRLDGGNYVDEYTNVNQPFPFPDALQEFSVQTSNYSAEYGQNAGAVVNVVTKAGTNNLHGDAFEFVRNAVFNARNFFSNFSSPDEGRDALKRNQFGGTIGGPIIHDRTFFFAGYQSTRIRHINNASNATVPTAAQRATATDPAVINLLQDIPVGNASGRVTFAKPDNQNFDDAIGRLDHSFRQNDHLTLRYDYNRFNKPASFDLTNLLTYADGSTIINQNYMIHESHIFNPRFINDFRFSFARETSNRGPAADAVGVRSFGVSIPFQPPQNTIESISVNGGPSFGDNPKGAFVRNNFTWMDDIAWVKGNHNLRFGGEIERSRVDITNLFHQGGLFSFANMTSFLSGTLNSFTQGAGEFKNNRNLFSGAYAQDDFHISRRLTLNFGLRWEPFLPWHEIKGRVAQFVMADAHPGGPTSSQFTNAPPGLFYPGDPGVPQYGVDPSYNNFAPRLGFAYDVFGDGRTSLRGGAGIFYDTRVSGIINNRFVDQTPFSPQVTPGAGSAGSFSDPYCTQASTQATIKCTAIANPFPSPFPPPSNLLFPSPLLVISYDPSTKLLAPTVYNWNLTVEHEFSRSFLVRAAYVGSHGTHIKETLELDPAAVGSGTAKLDSRRRLNTLIPGCSPTTISQCLYGSVSMESQDINSQYHALQLSVERRVSNGLTILGSYTYSKSMDDLPQGGGVADIGADNASARPWDDPLRHQFDRGPSDFDHTHNFVTSYVWQLPRLSNMNGLVRRVFGDWEQSGQVTAQTGAPFTVLSGLSAGSDLSQTGLGHDRATYIGGPLIGPGACAAAKATQNCVDFLNVAAFAPNTVPNPSSPGKTIPNPALIGTFGNMGKNSLHGPGFYDWNMGLFKNFLFTERWRLQFRAEIFNVFNRANFNNPNTSLNNLTNFGTITGANDPRIGQLALKLLF